MVQREEFAELINDGLSQIRDSLVNDFRLLHLSHEVGGDYCSIKQACKLLNISRQTFFVWRKSYKINTYMIGTAKRFKKSEILAQVKKV